MKLNQIVVSLRIIFKFSVYSSQLKSKTLELFSSPHPIPHFLIEWRDFHLASPEWSSTQRQCRESRCAVEIMGDAISLCTGLNDTKDEKFEKKVSVNAFLHPSSLPSPHRSIDLKLVQSDWI
jgi:hypothetical protein